MYKTQKGYEETVSVVQESTTTRGSGGIGIITEGTSTDIKMLVLPDNTAYVENRTEGAYFMETLFGHVRKTEMEKVSLQPGRTKIIWNGNTYRVMSIIDYTSKDRWLNAEIRMQRKIDVI